MKIPLDLRLPAFPVSIVQLLGLLDNDRAQTGQISSVLRTDPSLTATTLRMANSTFYRCGEAVSDLDAAIRRLGTAKLVEVVAVSWFAARLPEVVPFYLERAEDLWRHSVASAVICQRLASELGMPAAVAFTAGLLHDIGKVVLATAPRVSQIRLVCEPGESPRDAERRIIGVAHDEIGGQLAKTWRLPAALGEAIRWHHQPSAAFTAETKKLATLVGFSSSVARTFGFGADAIDLERPFDNAALELGLKPDQTERAMVDSLDAIEALVENARPKAT